MTPAVRLIRHLIAASVVGAVVAGLVRGLASTAPAKTAVIDGLCLTQVALAAILIVLGSLVEGYGFGLSLGTRWPYTRNILVLMVQGDPEAAHRVVATLVGVIGVALVILTPTSATISGLALVVATALFGIGTLYVLAGRLPSLVHGVHGLLAYGVFLAYLSTLFDHDHDFWSYVGDTRGLIAVLVAVLLGGMTTGQRGFGQPIEAFSWPRRTSQWVMIVHLFAALSVLGALGSHMPDYRVAFSLALFQVVVGFLLFHAVNLKPESPGILVAFHQCMVLAITVAIVAA